MKKILSITLAAVMAVSALPFSANAEEKGEMRDITTMELVREMGIGINLGNTLEACGDWIADVDTQWGDGVLTVTDYETAWGSPVITKEMIQGMADEGFGVVRVPVAWSNLMEEGYKISKDYDNRVHEVVDWVLEADMYCIINIHWDNGWVNTFPNNKDECMKRYESMWTQIADSFKDYDDHLMFESQNEELGWESVWNPWGSTDGKAESYGLVNEINQKFVDVIRASGGNNPERHLLISGYNTGFDRTCDPLFKMPSDPANRMAVSVHYYTPAGFAILEEDADWGKAISTWGSDADFNELKTNMDMMKKGYIDKGIPVIVGEYGCPTTNKEPDSVRLFLSSVCKEAYESGLCPVLWSTPGGHYDRDTCKMADQELKKLFNEIWEKPQTETNPPVDVTVTTTATTTTTTSIATTTAPTEPVVSAKVLGDANYDGIVTIADAAAIYQHLGNFDKYALSEQGTVNADIDGEAGVTVSDAIMILQFEAGIITEFSIK